MLKKLFLLIIPFVLLIAACGEKKENEEVSKPLYELKPASGVPIFNADNAYSYVEKQVAFGPRNPNSAAHEKAYSFLYDELKQYADEITTQQFEYPGYDNERLQLKNIIAKFNPSTTNRILLCAHWDSRPRAEHAFDKANVNKPILGANDGASGVAVLIEIARLLKEKKLSYGVDIVLFDGEDYGTEHDLNNFCLGSKYFAANLPQNFNYAFGILLDMVGDKEAYFPLEKSSVNFAPDVVKMLWGTAERVNAAVFTQADAPEIYDDHTPLNQAGLKTVDIIDLELIGADTPNKRRNYWHSDKDDMNNISKETLNQTGVVLANFLYSLQFNK